MFLLVVPFRQNFCFFFQGGKEGDQCEKKLCMYFDGQKMIKFASIFFVISKVFFAGRVFIQTNSKKQKMCKNFCQKVVRFLEKSNFTLTILELAPLHSAIINTK
jgi:hypothetical protein